MSRNHFLLGTTIQICLRVLLIATALAAALVMMTSKQSTAVVMTLVMAGCAATTAIGYMGKHGNAHARWMPIRDHLSKFCGRVTISIAISYVSFLLLMILTVISACNSGTRFRYASSKLRGGDHAENQSG
ncbi:hypothetical protein NL676_018586 [Syzygium grande]|nr:hypothetical protein NL676_018586 [Syzygium grande]